MNTAPETAPAAVAALPDEAKVVFADIENQALANFVGIVIRETHISQSRPS